MQGKKTVLYKRKREGRTNYKKRLSLLKSNQPRLIIRKSNKQVIIQIAEYKPDGDLIICGVNSATLRKHGWKYACNNLSACYLAGLMLGKRAANKKIKQAVFDAGLQTPVKGSRIYATLKGVFDAGIKVPVSKDVFPSEDRLKGKHITTYFKSSKSKEQFAKYKKDKANPEELEKDFEQLKKKITQNNLNQKNKKHKESTTSP